MTVQTVVPLTVAELQKAYDGSYYTICGAGGELKDWLEGYEKAMKSAGINAPSQWFSTTGAAVNAFASERGNVHFRGEFEEGLRFLMFPLDSIGAGGKLAMFKIQMQDRWFDDIIQNMTRGR